MEERNDIFSTLEDVERALKNLTPKEFVTLRQQAARLTYGTSYRDPEDLLSDAILSMLEGVNLPSGRGRRWPTNIPLKTFLWNAMRSIASNNRKKISTRAEVSACDLISRGEEEEDDVLERVSTTHNPSVEAQLIDEENTALILKKRDDIFEIFSCDDEVFYILSAMEEGCRGDKISSVCGMTKLQYEAARKRMRRGIIKLI